MTAVFTHLHHIGLVVPDIRARIEAWQDLLRWQASPVVEQPEIDARLCLLTPTGGTGASLELVEPASPGSAIAGYLERNRHGGLHHMCWSVGNLESTAGDLRRRGWLPTMKPFHAVLFGGARVAFFLSPERALVEVVETGVQC